jgi:hypothetical protein
MEKNDLSSDFYGQKMPALETFTVKFSDNCMRQREIYECSGGPMTLREEHRLRVFENMVLRRTFGPKREEVAGGWRKLHNEELHNFYLRQV